MKTFTAALIFVIMVFIGGRTVGQNLVVNPSFEDTISCPAGPDDLSACAGWSSYRPSPDYYHAGCPMSVPYNWGGYQPAASGNAYTGIATYLSGNTPYREYIGSMLSTSLIVGEEYFISFKVALSINWAVGGNCASNKMGVMFSTVPYSASNPAQITNYAATYTDSIITDTVNWTTVSGSFIADSAYSYIIIGNFFDDIHTDTIKITTGFFDAAYYYLDDVSVFADTAIGIKQTQTNFQFQISPNPFTTHLQLHYTLTQPGELMVYDALGRKVKSCALAANQKTFELSMAELPAGVYLVAVNSGGRVWGRKW